MSTLTPYTFTTATGAAAIDESVAPAKAGKLLCVKLHLSAAGGASENLTVTLNANAGAAYDTVLLTQNMEAVTDVIQVFDVPIQKDDTIDVAYTNSNARTWGLEVTTRPGV